MGLNLKHSELMNVSYQYRSNIKLKCFTETFIFHIIHKAVEGESSLILKSKGFIFVVLIFLASFLFGEKAVDKANSAGSFLHACLLCFFFFGLCVCMDGMGVGVAGWNDDRSL